MNHNHSSSFTTLQEKNYFFYLAGNLRAWACKLSVLANDQQYFPGPRSERIGRAGLYRKMARQAMRKKERYLEKAE